MEIASVLLKTADLVLKFLGSPIVKEIKSISNYETEFKMLANTVEFIGDVLSDVEGKQFKEASVIKGYKRLREAFLDAEDFLDRVQTLRKMRKADDNKLKKTRRFFSKSNPAKYAIEVHDTVKKIRMNLDAIVLDLQKFGLKEACIRPEETLTTARATGSFVDATRIIGREEDKRKIVELLSRSSFAHQKIPVISIVGMGGMGKTTLAQLIYDDEGWQKSCRFIMKSWVSDSKKLDLKSLLRNILKSFSPNDAKILDHLEEDHLKDRLKEIRGKSFLLVLDDVEDEDPWNWETLEGLLNCGNKEKSRIVITTRSRRVADVVGSSDLTYVLKGLEEKDSFDLFKRYAFRGSMDKSLIDIGIDIVEKCNGVPLAIKVIGSYLRDKVRSKWERVSYHGLERDKNPIISILKMSYDGLESTLKQCFSLCALFPKNYSIPKEILTGIWMVHVRFPTQRQGTLEEVCDDALEILCERFFLEKETSDYWLKGVYFKMHDLMHDLVTEIGEEEILVMDSKAKLMQYESIHEKVRHVSLDRCLLEDDKGSTFDLKGRRLRTLLRIESDYLNEYNQWIEKILSAGKLESSYPYLRMLDVRASRINNLTNSIGKLIHLRHLDLSYNEFQILPSSFSELINLRYFNLSFNALAQMTFRMDALTNLEEFDLRGCEKLEQLPPGIDKLVSLRRFMLSGCRSLTQMPFGMDALTTLEELDVSECWKLEQLPTGIEKLVSLRRFMLTGCRSLTHMPFGMDALTKLEELDVSECWKLEQLPTGIEKLVSLRRFRLAGCQTLTHMPFGIDALTTLEELDVSQCWKLEQLPTGIEKLVSLRRFRLAWCQTLTHMPFGIDALTALEELDLFGCEKLEELPTGIEKLVSLSRFRLAECRALTRMPFRMDVLITLEELNISWCVKLEQLPTAIEKLVGLRRFILVSCRALTQMPIRMDALTNLKELDVSGCWKLDQLPTGIEKLVSLRRFMLTGCRSLTQMPFGMDALTRLEELDVSKCWKLEQLPTGIERLVSLRRFMLAGCGALTRMPFRMDALTALQEFDVSGCWKLDQLPTGIEKLVSLRRFMLTGCRSLTRMPFGMDALTRLEELDVSKCWKLEQLPTDIERLVSLRRFMLTGCGSLTRMPFRMDALTALQEFDVSGCERLEQLPMGIEKLVISRRKFDINLCNALTEMPSGVGALMHICTPSRIIISPLDAKHAAQLEELRILSKTNQGELRIDLPSNIVVKGQGDGEAYLLNKEWLRKLEINWKERREDVDPRNHMDVLDKLQPHPNLKEFRLDGYQGITFPPWMPNLMRLEIWGCGKCRHLPPLSTLPYLRRLIVCFSSSLEYIEEEYNVSTVSFCPSLEVLRLDGLPKLMGWSKSSMLPSFPRLNSLRINSCSELNVEPILLSFVKVFASTPTSYLSLFVQVCRDDGSIDIDLSEHNHHLVYLTFNISGLNARGSRTSVLLNDTFRGMSDRITHLKLDSFSGFKTFPRGLLHLNALQRLCIMNCCDFTGEEDDGEMSWKGLTDLTLQRLPKMIKLPQRIQLLASLRRVSVRECTNFTLPEWVHNTFDYHTYPYQKNSYILQTKKGCSSWTEMAMDPCRLSPPDYISYLMN